MTEVECGPEAPSATGSHRPGMAWSAARGAAWAGVGALPPTEMPLTAARGSTAAVDLRALVPMPGVDTAAMDGYAVGGPGPWRLAGSLTAGCGRPPALSPGTCVGIATGAAVPAGSDGVVPVERSIADGRTIIGEVGANRHVRRSGEDARTGDLLVPAGQPLRPATLGLLAAAGYDRILVHRRPAVTILVTGDELRTAGPPGDGFVRDALGPMLPALLERWDTDVAGLELVRDTPSRALEAGIAGSTGDAVFVCGATSAGTTDRLRPLLAGLRARSVVDSVSCRPGHPQLLALLPDGRPLVGLPGNPFAALGAALTLGWAVVSALAGRSLPTLPEATMVPVPETLSGLTRLVPVRWHGPLVRALPRAAPGSLRAAALADAVAVVEPARRPTDPVPLLPLC